MAPEANARLGIWGPLVIAVITGVVTAGVAYGMLGASVNRNTQDIYEASAAVTGLLVFQGKIETELKGVNKRIDRILEILEH